MFAQAVAAGRVLGRHLDGLGAKAGVGGALRVGLTPPDASRLRARDDPQSKQNIDIGHRDMSHAASDRGRLPTRSRLISD